MIRLDTLGSLALTGANGEELRTVLTQPKRLALLCYLTVESARGFQRRDHLLALFWPELDQIQARQALRQALYFLRHELGDEVLVNRGADELRIAPDAITCDVCMLTELLDREELERALSLYHGDFLEGLFVRGASNELQRWLDGTRDELRRRMVDAAWTLSDLRDRCGDSRAAMQWARYANRLAPDDERSLRRLLRFMSAQGDRAGALRVYAEFTRWLAAEFDAAPSVETGALIAAVQGRNGAADLRV